MGLSRPQKSSPAELVFGGQNAGNTTTRRWFGAPYIAGTMPTSARPRQVGFGCVLTEIRVDCVAGTGSGTVTCTVFVDGVATAVLVAFANAGTSAVATGFAVPVAAGQRVSVALDKAGTITAGQVDLTATVLALAA